MKSKTIIFIDYQHVGKPSLSKVGDRGASVDIDGDGSVEAGECEAYWTRKIGLEIEIKLIEKGVKVIPLSDGWYGDRHNRVNEYSKVFKGYRQIYLAMHLNAGGGNYSAFFHYPNSTGGKVLAENLADAMEKHCGITNKKVWSATPEQWKGPYNTIDGVNSPIAICCEPLFMDSLNHLHLLSDNGIELISNAFVDALLK
tara:strand:+ start:18946 stop:19542 length:597 start_codon:yes stop_codon:yes gene_type:complete